jgi:hypothetical protein
VGVNSAVESVYGYDISNELALDAWQRAQRGVAGVSALTGTAAGGIAAAARYPTIFPTAARAAGVAAVTPRALSVFRSGELFERTFATSKGPVGVLAEVEVQGEALLLKDIVVFGEGRTPLTGLTKEVLGARTQIIDEARLAGFKRLRITGQRVAGSTSANPGKLVDIMVDLEQ